MEIDSRITIIIEKKNEVYHEVHGLIIMLLN